MNESFESMSAKSTKAQNIIPYFVEQGGGFFVNTASTGDARPRPDGVWYCCTKGAVGKRNQRVGIRMDKAQYSIQFDFPCGGRDGNVSRFITRLSVGLRR